MGAQRMEAGAGICCFQGPGSFKEQQEENMAVDQSEPTVARVLLSPPWSQLTALVLESNGGGGRGVVVSG